MDEANKQTGGSSESVETRSTKAAGTLHSRVPMLPLLDGLLRELEAWRKELSVSREVFAVTTLGISHSTYERWLRGNFNPRLKDALHYVALLADRDLAPSRLNGRSDPILAELWENPLDESYDEL